MDVLFGKKHSLHAQTILNLCAVYALQNTDCAIKGNFYCVVNFIYPKDIN